MSDKWIILDTAQTQYKQLMDLLETQFPENPYSLLPPELEDVTREYGGSGPWRISMDFSEALRTYWTEIAVSTGMLPLIEKIVREDINAVWELDAKKKKNSGNTGSFSRIEEVYRLIKSGNYNSD